MSEDKKTEAQQAASRASSTPEGYKRVKSPMGHVTLVPGEIVATLVAAGYKVL